MKFLCVSCNSQMKLLKNQAAIAPDAKGSLAIQFECPKCLMIVGLLTNPFETQLVTSLGVEIGGETVKASKCPFTETARQAMAGDTVANELASNRQSHDAQRTTHNELPWTAQAFVRLQNIPEFVRSYAKKGIESFAKERGYSQVNEKCLDEAKDHFNM